MAIRPPPKLPMSLASSDASTRSLSSSNEGSDDDDEDNSGDARVRICLPHALWRHSGGQFGGLLIPLKLCHKTDSTEVV